MPYFLSRTKNTASLNHQKYFLHPYIHTFTLFDPINRVFDPKNFTFDNKITKKYRLVHPNFTSGLFCPTRRLQW